MRRIYSQLLIAATSLAIIVASIPAAALSQVKGEIETGFVSGKAFAKQEIKFTKSKKASLRVFDYVVLALEFQHHMSTYSNSESASLVFYDQAKEDVVNVGWVAEDVVYHGGSTGNVEVARGDLYVSFHLTTDNFDLLIVEVKFVAENKLIATEGVVNAVNLLDDDFATVTKVMKNGMIGYYQEAINTLK